MFDHLATNEAKLLVKAIDLLVLLHFAIQDIAVKRALGSGCLVSEPMTLQSSITLELAFVDRAHKGWRSSDFQSVAVRLAT